MHMSALINVYIRKIMDWGISNSIGKRKCMDVIEAAIAENGVPEISNSNHGSNYNNPSWTNYLKEKELKY